MKNNFIRQILSLIASFSVLFVCVPFCNVDVPAVKASVMLPDPIYSYDFEVDEAEKGCIVGGGSLVESDSAERGRVFENQAGVNGIRRANYFQLPEDLFAAHADRIANNKGLTVSFFVNGNGNAELYAPVFSAYAAPPENDANTAPMFVIQGRQIIQLNANGASDFISDDNLEGFNCLSIDHLKDNKWHNITVTISDTRAAFYVDGVAVNTWKHDVSGFLGGEGIGTLRHICLGGNQAWTWKDPDAFYQFDDIRIFAEELDSGQIYKMLSGREPVMSDKTALRAAIRTSTIQQELYTEESLTKLYSIRDEALKVLADGEATQTVVDEAEEKLLLAMRRDLIKKTVDLEQGLLLDTDFTTATAQFDMIYNRIIANGYQIKPVGASTIEHGHIQSSENGASRSAGIAVDRKVLDNIDIDQGITFNIKWRFSTVNTEQWADFWDLIAFVSPYDDVLMKNTIGYIFVVQGYPWMYPNIDTKNGFEWYSCKKYKSDTDMDLAVTIDSSGCRMYVDGVLARELTEIPARGIDCVFNSTQRILIGRDTEGNRGDLMGGLYGLQIYDRTLNAAEIEALAKRETVKELAAAVFTTDQNADVSIKKEGTNVFVTRSDSKGIAVVNSLIKGATYEYAISGKDRIVLTGSFTAGTDTNLHVVSENSIKTDEKDKQQTADKQNQQPQKIPVVAKVTLYTGNSKNSIQINAKVSGASREANWSTSDPAVAVVSKGTVKAVRKGTALITARANGLAKAVQVTVKNPSVVVKKGRKKVTHVAVRKKKTMKGRVTVTPDGSGIKIHKISGKKRIKVNLKKNVLIIKGRKKGRAQITLQSGKATKKITVKVK